MVLLLLYRPSCGPKGQQGCLCLCTSRRVSFICCLLGSFLMIAPSLWGCTAFWSGGFLMGYCSTATLWHCHFMVFRLQSLKQQHQDSLLFMGRTDGFAEDPGAGIWNDLHRLLLEWEQCFVHVRLGLWPRQTWFLSLCFSRQNGHQITVSEKNSRKKPWGEVYMMFAAP